MCLGLRDGHGQLARATTNKDALVLSMLTEAQSGSAARATAAPCPLRGLRRASVVTADSPGVQLATTASLLLAAAKIRDHVDDGEVAGLARKPLAKAAARWGREARAGAARIGLDVDPLVAALDAQVRLEQETKELVAVGAAARPAGFVPEPLAGSPDWRSAMAPSGDPLDRLTAPTQLCASAFFAHTAVLAERPDNIMRCARPDGNSAGSRIWPTPSPTTTTTSPTTASTHWRPPAPPCPRHTSCCGNRIRACARPSRKPS
ncbi:hypothetical protein ACRS5S_26090 [Nocardia asiatica]|uniref:hypothetical protein n=1 Tax=Nocardia asiatica TaxID=209252 RepID=UPI003EE134BF